jgi:hypothetical protein
MTNGMVYLVWYHQQKWLEISQNYDYGGIDIFKKDRRNFQEWYIFS